MGQCFFPIVGLLLVVFLVGPMLAKILKISNNRAILIVFGVMAAIAIIPALIIILYLMIFPN